MTDEHVTDPAEGRAKAKVTKHFVEKVFATWGRPREQTRIDAYIEAAVYDLSPLTVEQLTEAFHAVRREWAKDYRPEVVEFRRAAARLGFFDGKDKSGGDVAAARAEARRKAEGFQVAYMSNFRNALVDEAWRDGFYREMREYLVTEAMRQFLDGANQLNIPFPDDLVARWREIGRRNRETSPLSPEMARILDDMRANFDARRAG